MRKYLTVLWALCVVEIILWIIGMAYGYRMGGFLHITLALAALAAATELFLDWRRKRRGAWGTIQKEGGRGARRAA